MNQGVVNAMPTKEFFIETLVRDISLIDCILDLIDNSIDGYIRNNYKDRRNINIVATNNSFKIVDDCGGISYDMACKEVFRLGFLGVQQGSRLSVYGIGLKRAIFKIGNNITFESDDTNDYCKVKIDLADWKKPESPWTFPIYRKNSSGQPFTRISIANLNNDISKRFSLDVFFADLIDKISKTYFLYLQDRIKIVVNGTAVEPYIPKIAFSEEIKPAYKELSLDSVTFKITAGITPQIELSGWYIFCNDRSVLLGDKTSLTGWGRGIVPQFHPKYNSFVGFVRIYSEDPLQLPWTTSKTSLNTNSPVYEKLIKEIETITRPITSYFDRAYSQKQIPEDRPLFRELPSKAIHEITEKQNFAVVPIKRARHPSIQYKKPIEDIERIRKCLKKPWMSYKEIGIKTFDYFMDMECIEDGEGE